MTKGDKLLGIKNKYKGVEMRSKLESKVAMFLDALGILWIYEPKTFRLSNHFSYKPDFYLPKLKIWIEVKGLIEDHNRKISKIFVRDNKQALVLISSNSMLWYGLWKEDDNNEVFEDLDVLIGKCSKCKSYFLASNLGDWKCLSCDYYEGDNSIIGSINGQSWIDEKIDFSDLKSIKEWVNGRKTSF